MNQEDLRSFLTVAEDLRVRGLTQMDLEKKTEDNDNNIIHSDEIDDHDQRSRSPINHANANLRTNFSHHMTEVANDRRRKRPSLDDESSGIEPPKRTLQAASSSDFRGIVSSTPRDYSIDHGSDHSSPFHQGMYSAPNLVNPFNIYYLVILQIKPKVLMLCIPIFLTKWQKIGSGF